jgi:hypothetical protein
VTWRDPGPSQTLYTSSVQPPSSGVVSSADTWAPVQTLSKRPNPYSGLKAAQSVGPKLVVIPCELYPRSFDTL